MPHKALNMDCADISICPKTSVCREIRNLQQLLRKYYTWIDGYSF